MSMLIHHNLYWDYDYWEGQLDLMKMQTPKKMTQDL